MLILFYIRIVCSDKAFSQDTPINSEKTKQMDMNRIVNFIQSWHKAICYNGNKVCEYGMPMS